MTTTIPGSRIEDFGRRYLHSGQHSQTTGASLRIRKDNSWSLPSGPTETLRLAGGGFDGRGGG